MDRGVKQQHFRKKILGRDDGKCQYCQCGHESNRGIKAHHIIPVSEGGDYSKENGIALCKHHHNAVHTLRRLDGEINDPVELLEKYEIPERFPDHPALKKCANWMVFNVLKDECQTTPLRIRERTGLEKQRVNDALNALVAAGGCRARTEGYIASSTTARDTSRWRFSTRTNHDRQQDERQQRDRGRMEN